MTPLRCIYEEKIDMKKLYLISLILIAPCILRSQTGRVPESAAYSFPISFIKNAGQWSPEILFGNMLGNQKAMLMKDGIVIPRKSSRQDLPGETAKRVASFARLRFVHPLKKWWQSALPPAVHGGAIGITPAAFVSPQASIEVEYEVYKATGADPAPEPHGASLSQNHPNPVNGERQAAIDFSLEKDGYASIRLFDLLGRPVAVIFEGNAKAGPQRVWFNAARLAPGMYTYVLAAEGRVRSRVMMVVK
jgi:hypothetical protein